MSWVSMGENGFGGDSGDAEEGCQLRGFQQTLHSSTTEMSSHYIRGVRLSWCVHRCTVAIRKQPAEWFSPWTMWVLEIVQARQQVPLPISPSV